MELEKAPLRMTFWRIVLLAVTSVTWLCAANADFAAGGGAGPVAGNARTDPRGNDVDHAIGGTLLFSGAFDLLHRRRVEVGLVIPVAVHGSRRLDIFARGGYAGVYTERLTAVVTAGIRVRLAPARRRISPWLSYGSGMAVIHRTGADFQSSQSVASQFGSSRALALTPAAGADIRLTRTVFVRLEMQNYLYQTPATGFVSSFVYWNRWNHNPVVAGSVGFRLH